MTSDKVHFTDVVTEEYTTIFDFYINQLQFQYFKGNTTQIKQYLNDLEARSEKYHIIEALKCGHDYIIYMDRGIK